MRESVQRIDPAEGILDPAPLDAGHGVIQVLRHRADLAAIHCLLLALVAPLPAG